MIQRLRSAWESREPRERVVLAVLVGVALVLFYVWLIQTVDPARQHLRKSVSTLRAQLVTLERQAAEVARLQGQPVPPGSTSDLRATVQTQIETAGLSQVLVSINVISPGQVRVSFGAVSFADWLAWVTTLAKLQIRLDACRIEALAAPGMVSATATLTRATPR